MRTAFVLSAALLASTASAIADSVHYRFAYEFGTFCG